MVLRMGSKIYRPIWPASYGAGKQTCMAIEKILYGNGKEVNGIVSLCWKIVSLDDTLCQIGSKIKAKHIRTGKDIVRPVLNNSLLSLVDRFLQGSGYRCCHLYYPDREAILLNVEAEDELNRSVGEDAAILVFLNGVEPRKGKIGLDQVTPKAGDMVMVGYASKSYWDGYY